MFMYIKYPKVNSVLTEQFLLPFNIHKMHALLQYPFSSDTYASFIRIHVEHIINTNGSKETTFLVVNDTAQQLYFACYPHNMTHIPAAVCLRLLRGYTHFFYSLCMRQYTSNIHRSLCIILLDLLACTRNGIFHSTADDFITNTYVLNTLILI